eukprot:7140751-Prorocentrum_lima.AAC.1
MVTAAPSHGGAEQGVALSVKDAPRLSGRFPEGGRCSLPASPLPHNGHVAGRHFTLRGCCSA